MLEAIQSALCCLFQYTIKLCPSYADRPSQQWTVKIFEYTDMLIARTILFVDATLWFTVVLSSIFHSMRTANRLGDNQRLVTPSE